MQLEVSRSVSSACYLASRNLGVIRFLENLLHVVRLSYQRKMSDITRSCAEGYTDAQCVIAAAWTYYIQPWVENFHSLTVGLSPFQRLEELFTELVQ